jgi:hypothetical protein
VHAADGAADQLVGGFTACLSFHPPPQLDTMYAAGVLAAACAEPVLGAAVEAAVARVAASSQAGHLAAARDALMSDLLQGPDAGEPVTVSAYAH